MALSRRDFVKLCTGTVAGFGVSQMFHPLDAALLLPFSEAKEPLGSGPLVTCFRK